ncbi:hypothetical protein [Streptobacillus notomytis]|uniref:hypothetical protein n=1 Tax=Streptobacillus notomytis TaxID=1712031 RepID=UPI000A408D37|nr:hypothetical protein [Streptobacillus notomytis]
MGKININNKTILGILALSSLSSLSTTMYVKNNSELKLEHKDSKFEYRAVNTLSTGALVGRNKEVFIYLGGEIEKTKVYDGKVNIGLGFKKNLNEHIELTLNGGFQYMDGMEDSIKEGLKLRGLWDSKYDEDERARKDFYHSQGLRLKGSQILVSGVVDLNYNTTISKIGTIYTSETLNSGTGRLENFLNLNQKIGKSSSLELNLNHKLKTDIYKRLGRLKGDIKLSTKLGNLEIIGKGHTYLGTILISDRNQIFGGEFGLIYNKDNFNLKNILKHDVELDYSKNWRNTAVNGALPRNDVTNSLLHKQEIIFDLGYKGNIVEFSTKNNVKGKIFTDISSGIKLNTEKYKKDNKNKNKDFTVLSAYTENELKAKSSDFELKLESRYRYNMDIDDKKNMMHNHLGLAGFGITYDKKSEVIETKHNFSANYVLGYLDKKKFSILNLWTDNDMNYRVSDKLKLIGELNLTSSNRLKIFDNKETEVLGLGDAKARVEYKVTDRLELRNEIGANAILLFSHKNENSQDSNNDISNYIKTLLLHTQYQYKVYNENTLLYKIRDGVKIIGKLKNSYLNGYDSEKLYSSLRDIKRKQLGENGIIDISKKDRDKISEEKEKYGKDNLTKIIINPSIEMELKFLENRLTMIPKVGVMLNVSNKDNDNTFKYNNTIAKVELNIDYKW